MIIHPTVGNTLDFIRIAHEGQLDKAGVPYWKHCVRVMMLMPSEANEATLNAALIHDVFEDTRFKNEDDIEAVGYRFHGATLAYARALTRSENELYRDYIDRLEGYWPLRIKEADLIDHLSPSRMQYISENQMTKYIKALERVRNKLDNLKREGVE